MDTSNRDRDDRIDSNRADVVASNRDHRNGFDREGGVGSDRESGVGLDQDAAVWIDQLTHTYSDGRTSLRGVSLRIQVGERVALIGPNGAGKTTLFLCLTGVLTPRAGQLRVMGLDPTSPRDRRILPSKVGIVFQNSDDQLFQPTLYDDVAFGPLNLNLPESEVRQRVEEALRAVRLEGQGERVPYRLSGGEKRRAALAGVLAMRPEVILLDEPSLYLDPRGRRELICQLRDLPGTQVIATHDLDLVLDLCPRAILMDAGICVAQGPSHELLADAQRMEAHGLEVPYRLR